MKVCFSFHVLTTLTFREEEPGSFFFGLGRCAGGGLGGLLGCDVGIFAAGGSMVWVWLAG